MFLIIFICFDITILELILGQINSPILEIRIFGLKTLKKIIFSHDNINLIDFAYFVFNLIDDDNLDFVESVFSFFRKLLIRNNNQEILQKLLVKTFRGLKSHLNCQTIHGESNSFFCSLLKLLHQFALVHSQLFPVDNFHQIYRFVRKRNNPEELSFYCLVIDPILKHISIPENIRNIFLQIVLDNIQYCNGTTRPYPLQTIVSNINQEISQNIQIIKNQFIQFSQSIDPNLPFGMETIHLFQNLIA